MPRGLLLLLSSRAKLRHTVVRDKRSGCRRDQQFDLKASHLGSLSVSVRFRELSELGTALFVEVRGAQHHPCPARAPRIATDHRGSAPTAGALSSQRPPAPL
eukprot:2900430-Prymnesium_polylepis.2